VGRGFLSGIFWGGIVGLVALFVSHEALDRQVLSFPQPNATEVEVPGGSEFNQARPETDPVVPGTDTRPEADGVSGVAVPDDTVGTPPVMDTTALEVPVPATTQEAPESLGTAPEAVSDVEEPQVAEDVAVETARSGELEAPEAPAAAPEAPVVELETSAADQSDRETAPQIEADAAPEVETGTEIAALPETGDAPVQPSADAAPQAVGQSDAPGEPVAPAEGEAPSLPWLERLREAQIDEAPNAPSLPSVSEEPSLPPVGAEETASATPRVETPESPVTETPSGGTAREETAQPEVETAQADPPSPGLEPVETLTQRDDEGVDATSDDGTLPVVRRFGDGTTLTDAPEVEEAAPEEEVAVETEEDSSGVPALQAFASTFDGSEGLPLISIILVHQGEAALNPTILDVLPPHVAFAVDASLPDAGRIAAAYRAAGREVVMIPSLPIGATPQDIEQALTVNFDQIPEAVAVMDVSGASFQSDRDAVQQVVDVVSASGHGLITFPRGLNTAHQSAQRAGVPTGLIFRNLDGNGEDQEEIRRSLDRAAFRARQDDAVILVGTTGSTMLSALTEWVLGNRATTVTIAPVSVALGG
jgi:polysaccharide deacetylase 2 family uncharacterized protein YibQ